MHLSGKITHDDPDPDETMAIITGHMGTALEINIPAKHAKTKHQATRTKPLATTPWAVA